MKKMVGVPQDPECDNWRPVTTSKVQDRAGTPDQDGFFATLNNGL